MTGQSIVSGSAPAAYARGTIRAVFQPQGGGKPTLLKNSAAIAADGSFSIQAWDNTNALYAPSRTVFLLEQAAPNGGTFSLTTTISGSTATITSQLTGA